MRMGAPASSRRTSFIAKLGPGLITGASKNDPSSITTYVKIGAQNGYPILWTMLFSYPLLAGIQEVSALLGRVTGRGVAGNVRKYYPRWILYSTVALLTSANLFNLGADIGAMAAAMELVVGGSQLLYAAGFTVLSLLIMVFVPYTRYVSILKWLTAALLSYVGTVFVIRVPWSHAIRALVVPSLQLNQIYLMALVATMGATINPYLLFWQASQEVEEVENTPGEEPLREEPQQSSRQTERIQLDTYVGMAFSNIIGYFILLTASVTLHSEGITNLQTASQAAEALRPIAGSFATILFSAGIIGSGLLAIPVLAGSAAYAVGETFRWQVGLERKPRHAAGFYGVLAVAMGIGMVLVFFGVDPVAALFAASLINGFVAVPLMAIMMLMSGNKRVMGPLKIALRLKITGWIATILMFAACLGLLASLL